MATQQVRLALIVGMVSWPPLAGWNEPAIGSVVEPGVSCLMCPCHLHACRGRCCGRAASRVWGVNAEKGYGFVSRAHGPDVFVHYSEVDGNGFRDLEENQHGEFEVTHDRRACRPQQVAGE